LHRFKLNSSHGHNHPDTGLGTNIVNLTGSPLSESERSLLNYGLTFVPTPKPKTGLDALLDNGTWEIKEFKRLIKLADFFGNTTSDVLPFVDKTGWEPKLELVDPAIYDSVHITKDRIGGLVATSDKQMLSVQERQALKGVCNNTVIMTKDNYIQEALRQLNNVKDYTNWMKLFGHTTIPYLMKFLRHY
jgi:hypothetical protein